MLAHHTTDTESSLLRSPKASDGSGGALGEAEARRRGNTIGVRDQVMDLVADQGLPVTRQAVNVPVLGTPTTATSGRSPEFRGDSAPNPVELAQAFAEQLAAKPELLPTPSVGHIRNHDEDLNAYLERRQDFKEGRTSGMPGPSLGVAIRLEQAGIDIDADPDLLPTPTVGDQREGKHLRSVAIENLAEGKSRGIGLNHLTEMIGVDWQEGDRFVMTEEGLEKVDELLPTPNTMEHREIKTPEQIAELQARSPGGYRNLREVVVNEIPEVLLPTVVVDDSKNTGGNTKRFPSLASVAHQELAPDQELLPTPKARDANAEGFEAGLRRSTPSLPTMAKVIDDPELLGTPRVSSRHHSSKQVAAGAPKFRLEDQVVAGHQDIINWGKFEPAIRRWERIIGRQAPPPTRPDGTNGSHRLNPVFTEWMMGLPEGWLTGIGLSRNNELKACGNGVVPQQAALALRRMLAIVDTLND